MRRTAASAQEGCSAAPSAAPAPNAAGLRQGTEQQRGAWAERTGARSTGSQARSQWNKQCAAGCHGTLGWGAAAPATDAPVLGRQPPIKFPHIPDSAPPATYCARLLVSAACRFTFSSPSWAVSRRVQSIYKWSAGRGSEGPACYTALVPDMRCWWRGWRRPTTGGIQGRPVKVVSQHCIPEQLSGATAGLTSLKAQAGMLTSDFISRICSAEQAGGQQSREDSWPGTSALGRLQPLAQKHRARHPHPHDSQAPTERACPVLCSVGLVFVGCLPTCSSVSSSRFLPSSTMSHTPLVFLPGTPANTAVTPLGVPCARPHTAGPGKLG